MTTESRLRERRKGGAAIKNANPSGSSWLHGRKKVESEKWEVGKAKG